MKRPLGFVALCYAAGLILAKFFQPPLFVLFSTALVLAGTAIFSARLRPVLLWPLLLLTGWTNLASRTTVVSPNDLRQLAGPEAQLVTVRGTLLETPSLRVFDREEKESFRTLAQVKIFSLARNQNWQPAVGTLMVTTPGILPDEFFAGQPVEISGVLEIPSPPIASGLFDYRSYLAQQGIYFQMKSGSPADWKSLNPTPKHLPFTEKFLAWAKRTMARGLPEEDEPLRLLWAMTLGWKTALTGEVNEPFMKSGTMHIFAISGLHIALIAGILASLLRVLQIPRVWCGVIIVPLLWFYTAATGWQPSAIRSTVMMTVIIFGWSLRRPTDLLNSLAAAGLIILLWEPQQLFQASFQLSFFVVLSIALLLPPLEKLRDRALQIDPLLPEELIPRWKRGLRSALRAVLTMFATSLAAWLGSLPLTAHYFHLLSPVTLLANLVIVPLSTLALMCSLGSLVCGDWFPWATELFNHGGWFWMWTMVETSHYATELPGAYFNQSPPSVFTFVVYYSLLIGTLSGWLFAPRRRVWTVVGLLIVAGVYFVRWQHSRPEVQLTVLPVNGGHSIYVNAAGTKNDWLIDCGNTNSFEFILKPFLRAQGVNRLPRLALTHGDLQHVGGTEPLQTAFGVREYFTSSIRFRSATYRRLAAELDEMPERHHAIHRGDQAGVWQVLHPQADDKFSQADDSALVLLGNFHGQRVLLLSDLGRLGQNALLERFTNLQADVVISGLPEQTEALSDALLEAIQPKIIVIADSQFPATKRASVKLRQRLQLRNVPVFYTRETGALEFVFRPEGWRLESVEGNILAGGEMR